jgi:hypothetical protein
MNRNILSRLVKLEAATLCRDSPVHVIPAHAGEEFEEERAALIMEHGAHPQDLFVRLRRFAL